MPSAWSNASEAATTTRSPLSAGCPRSAAVPQPGAIRNKPGEASRAHQNLRRLTDTKKPGGRSARTTEVNLILGGISDAVLRGRLGLLVAEFKATRAQLLAARHLANRTAILDMADSPRYELRPPATTRTPAEVRALENAVSPENLQHWRWRTDESGRVTTDSDRTVFAAGFVTGVRKAPVILRSDPVRL